MQVCPGDGQMCNEMLSPRKLQIKREVFNWIYSALALSIQRVLLLGIAMLLEAGM
jgi:hypothetical protein